jgi:hypothetical protein
VVQVPRPQKQFMVGSMKSNNWKMHSTTWTDFPKLWFMSFTVNFLEFAKIESNLVFSYGLMPHFLQILNHLISYRLSECLGELMCRLPTIQQEVQQRKLLYMGLYLLVWGEAANLRFMPECLCYIYHHVRSTFCFSGYTHPDNFSLSVVWPLSY